MAYLLFFIRPFLSLFPRCLRDIMCVLFAISTWICPHALLWSLKFLWGIKEEMPTPPSLVATQLIMTGFALINKLWRSVIVQRDKTLGRSVKNDKRKAAIYVRVLNYRKHSAFSGLWCIAFLFNLSSTHFGCPYSSDLIWNFFAKSHLKMWPYWVQIYRSSIKWGNKDFELYKYE